MPGVHAVVTGPRRASTSRGTRPARGAQQAVESHCRTKATRWPAGRRRTPYQAWTDSRHHGRVRGVAVRGGPRKTALKPDAPAIHQRATRRQPAVYERVTSPRIRRGRRRRRADLRTASKFIRQRRTHGSVAKWDDNRSRSGFDTGRLRHPVGCGPGAAAARWRACASSGTTWRRVRQQASATKQTYPRRLVASGPRGPVKLFVTREESLISQGKPPPGEDDAQSRR